MPIILGMEHDPLGAITAELTEAMHIESDSDFDKYVELLEKVQSSVLWHMAEAFQKKQARHRNAVAVSLAAQLSKPNKNGDSFTRKGR